MYYTVMNSRLCAIILVGDEQGLRNLHLDTGEGKRKFKIDEDWIENSRFFEKEIGQVNEYFDGKRTKFNLNLNPQGTEFQRKVWQALETIPYGETKTYQEIAILIGHPKSYRAVGMANSMNPIPLMVPCHRVIGKNGSMTGFAHGVAIKEKLLLIEKTMDLYDQLYKYHGGQNWWPADSPFEMMVGAILTQNTSWNNVEKAMNNFKKVLTPELIRESSHEKLAEIIRPTGYHNQKAIKLKALVNWLANYGDDFEKIKLKSGDFLRAELLGIHGIGRETADCILTYALDQPYFVIDAYTRRLFGRMGFHVPDNYDEFREMIEASISKDLDLYNEFHALIVRHCKVYCKKMPNCVECSIMRCRGRKPI